MAAKDLARARVEANDEPALVRVLETLRPKLVLICRHRGFSDAEDVVQEALIAATVGFRRGKFRRQSTIETWIYGILRNKIRDYKRARVSDSEHLIPIGEQVDERHEGGLPGIHLNPDLRLIVQEALGSLPARHWLVLILNSRQGLKTREIAPLIGLSTGRTGAILAEAKEMLRQALADRGAEENAPRARLIK